MDHPHPLSALTSPQSLHQKLCLCPYDWHETLSRVDSHPLRPYSVLDSLFLPIRERLLWRLAQPPLLSRIQRQDLGYAEIPPRNFLLFLEENMLRASPSHLHPIPSNIVRLLFWEEIFSFFCHRSPTTTSRSPSQYSCSPPTEQGPRHKTTGPHLRHSQKRIHDQDWIQCLQERTADPRVWVRLQKHW